MSSKPGTFKKGHDPRRNSAGNLNAEAQSWEIHFRNALAKRLDPEKAADLMAKAYLRAQAWAVNESHERLMGKVKQALEHSGAIKTADKLLLEVVHTRPEKPADGNGNGGNGGEKK